MQRIATAVVVGAVLALFAIVFGYAIVQVWQSSTEPTVSEALLYAATGLATVVGGAVAVAISVRPGAGAGAKVPGDQLAGSPLVIRIIADQLPNVLNIVYVVVYAAVGVGAVVTWVTHPDVTTDLVKNMATTFLALAIPTAGGYFRLGR
ncbi:MAG TPA: hypothetical protein VIC57_14185 [Candidatus Dormibacteraeota bacterium]|jgi:hypothetical protein